MAILRAHDHRIARVVKFEATPEQTYEIVAHRGKRVVAVARVRAGGRLWIATCDRESPTYHLRSQQAKTFKLLTKLADTGWR